MNDSKVPTNVSGFIYIQAGGGQTDVILSRPGAPYQSLELGGCRHPPRTAPVGISSVGGKRQSGSGRLRDSLQHSGNSGRADFKRYLSPNRTSIKALPSSDFSIEHRRKGNGKFSLSRQQIAYDISTVVCLERNVVARS